MSRVKSAGLSLDYDDVFQQMCETFCVAKKLFDPSKGFKFTTYLVTSIYREFNRWIERVFRGESFVSSVEELQSKAGEGLSLYDAISSGESTPEEIYERKESIANGISSLSGQARAVVEELIEPGESLKEAHLAYIAHAEHGRSLGVAVNTPKQDITFGFLCRHYRLGTSKRESIQREIKTNFGVKL